jgi:hypothetical protein
MSMQSQIARWGTGLVLVITSSIVPTMAGAQEPNAQAVPSWTHFNNAAQLMADTYNIDPAEAARRLAQDPGYGEISSYLDDTYKDDPTYGGAWIDHQNGGAFTVAATEPEAVATMVSAAEVAASILRQQAAERYAQDHIPPLLEDVDLTFGVVGTLVEHSRSDLIVSMSEVIDLYVETHGTPPQDIALELMRNRVTVGLPHDLPHELRVRLEDLARRLPGLELIEKQFSLADSMQEACPVNGCEFRGGITVERPEYPSYNPCSVGFTGVRNGAVGFYTAGHCATMVAYGPGGVGTGDQTHAHRDENWDLIWIGSLEAWRSDLPIHSEPLWIDIAFVSLHEDVLNWSQRGTIWTPDDPFLAIDGDFAQRSSVALGSWLCRSGWREEDDHLPHCGELLSSLPIGWVAPPTASCLGDSGGPWWRPSDLKAVGIHHGSRPPQDSSGCPRENQGPWFTFLSDGIAWLGGGTVDSGK